MTVIEVRFELEKETKGALRYQEIDEKGEAIEQALAKIGTLYMRKSAFEQGGIPPNPARDRRDGISSSSGNERQPCRRMYLLTTKAAWGPCLNRDAAGGPRMRQGLAGVRSHVCVRRAHASTSL